MSRSLKYYNIAQVSPVDPVAQSLNVRATADNFGAAEARKVEQFAGSLAASAQKIEQSRASYENDLKLQTERQQVLDMESALVEANAKFLRGGNALVQEAVDDVDPGAPFMQQVPGALSMRGRDAIGITGKAEAAFAAAVKQGKFGDLLRNMSPANARAAQRVINSQRDKVRSAAFQHETKERDTLFDETITARINVAVAEGANDPNVSAESIGKIKSSVQEKARRAGYGGDKARVENEIRGHVSRMRVNQVKQLVAAEKEIEAEELYRKAVADGEIDPKHYPELEKLVSAGSKDRTAQTFADRYDFSVYGSPVSLKDEANKARAAAREKFSGDQEAKVIAEINRREKEQAATLKAQQTHLAKRAVQKYIAGTRPSADERAALAMENPHTYNKFETERQRQQVTGFGRQTTFGGGLARFTALEANFDNAVANGEWEKVDRLKIEAVSLSGALSNKGVWEEGDWNKATKAINDIMAADKKQQGLVAKSKEANNVRQVVKDLFNSMKSAGSAEYVEGKAGRAQIEKRVIEEVARLRPNDKDREPVTTEEIRNIFRIALLEGEQVPAGTVWNPTTWYDPDIRVGELSRTEMEGTRITLDDDQDNMMRLNEIGRVYGLSSTAYIRAAVEDVINESGGRFSRDTVTAAYVRAAKFGQNMAQATQPGTIDRVARTVAYINRERRTNPNKQFSHREVVAIYNTLLPAVPAVQSKGVNP